MRAVKVLVCVSGGITSECGLSIGLCGTFLLRFERGKDAAKVIIEVVVVDMLPA